MPELLTESVCGVISVFCAVKYMIEKFPIEKCTFGLMECCGSSPMVVNAPAYSSYQTLMTVFGFRRIKTMSLFFHSARFFSASSFVS